MFELAPGKDPEWFIRSQSCFGSRPVAEPSRLFSSIETGTAIRTGSNGFGATGLGPMTRKWGNVE
jgi:hypothetical protein